MRRVEPEHQPVEKAAARRRAFDKQPVHLRGEPGDPDHLAERGLATRVFAVDAHDATLAASRVAARADLDLAAMRRDGRRDGPAGFGFLVIRAPAVEIRETRIAQATAGRKHRNSLQQVGLAGPVEASQHHRTGSEIEPCGPVIAKIGQRQAGHTDPSDAGRQNCDSGAVAAFMHPHPHTRAYGVGEPQKPA
jgi:hypothetical protein